MKFKKQLLIAAMMGGALGGLYGCTEGDDTSIVVEGDENPDPGPDPGPGPGPEVSDCPDWTDAQQQRDGTDVCELPSSITENRTLTADTIWRMDGRVTVGNGNQEIAADQVTLASGEPLLNVTLTVEPGTQIVGAQGEFANMIITRGSMIMAEGTADAPIIFSSEDEDFQGTGEFGGLILHGFGSHNQCPAEPPCNIDSEGESGFAAGYEPDDSSGVLRYVIVAEGGFEFAPGNEINGISLVGVGSGTEMEYIQVQGNSDDGIEFYGGDVNVKYLVLTDNLDDSVDWDEGFQGNLQYVIAKQSTDSEGNAGEYDTEGAASPLSKPTVANATWIGAGEQTVLHVLKASSGGFFHNNVMTWADGPDGKSCVEVDGSGAEQNVTDGSTVYENIIADCETFANVTFDANLYDQVPADLNDLLASQAAEAKLDAPIDWDAVRGRYPNSVADVDYLDATDYLGAVDPDATSAWYEGWILEGSLD